MYFTVPIKIQYSNSTLLNYTVQLFFVPINYTTYLTSYRKVKGSVNTSVPESYCTLHGEAIPGSAAGDSGSTCANSGIGMLSNTTCASDAVGKLSNAACASSAIGKPSEAIGR